MRTIIDVICQDQVLEAATTPLIASGGRHEDFVHFTFCEKWEGFKKVGVFYREAKTPVPYYSDLDSTNLCEVPHEVTDEPGTIYFGVLGVLGDVTRTSNMVKYKISNGAMTAELIPTDPSPGLWEQLLKAYTDVLKAVDDSNAAQAAFINNANKAVTNCNMAVDECYAAIAQLNYTAADLDGGDPGTEEVSSDVNDIEGGSPY